MPLVRRVPKRGFNNRYGDSVAVVNVSALDKAFQAGDEVTPDALTKKSLVSGRYDELKILGNGDLSKKLTVSAHRFSKSAVEKIEQSGGTIVRLPGKTPVEAKKKQKRMDSN